MGSGNLSGAKGNSHQRLNAHFASLSLSFNSSSLCRALSLLSSAFGRRREGPRPSTKTKESSKSPAPRGATVKHAKLQHLCQRTRLLYVISLYNNMDYNLCY